MNTIELHITYLLRHHDCVIVPAWGAFVARYEPARIDTDLGVIFPPARTISFNPDIAHNDGLLAASVVRTNGITYEAASQAIASCVKEWKLRLSEQGRLTLKHIGEFEYQQGSTPSFVATDSPLLSPWLANLAPVAAKPVGQTVSRNGVVRDDFSPAPRRMMRIFRSVGKIAASVALFICLGVLVSTPIVVDKTPDQASLTPLPTITPPQSIQAPVIIPEKDTLPALESEPQAKPETSSRQSTNVASKPEPKPKPAAVVPVRRIDDSDPYCLIVASLASSDEAAAYLSRATDKQLKLLEQDGKFRIYAATGQTVGQAKAHLTNGSLGRSYPGAWVCHR